MSKTTKHPDISYKSIQVICSCGYKFTTRSTYSGDILRIDICSHCHPFYTQHQNTAKRIDERSEKFNKKYDF